MTTPENDRNDAFLDSLFAEERSARALENDVSSDLLARVLGDAEAVQAEQAAPVFKTPAPARRPSLIAQIGAALGGWPAFAGLAAASMCGVWLGVSPPEGLSDTAMLYLGSTDTVLDPISGFDFDIGEG